MTGSHFPMQGKAEGAHLVRFFQIYLLGDQLRIVSESWGMLLQAGD